MKITVQQNVCCEFYCQYSFKNMQIQINTWGSFYLYESSSLQIWISNHMLSKVWDEISYPFPSFNGKYDNVSLVTKWGVYANAVNTKLILSKRSLAAKWASICREYIMTDDAPWKTVGNGCLPITLSWPIQLLYHLCMACAAGIS